MKVLRFPLVRFTICFIAGLLFANFIRLKPEYLYAATGILFLVVSVIYYCSKRHLIQKIWFGLSIYLLAGCLGGLTFVSHSIAADSSHYFHRLSKPGKIHVVDIVLREKLKSTENNDRYIATVYVLDREITSGKILVNFRRNSVQNLFVGCRLKLPARIFPNRLPYNPDQFDYGKYLAAKSIPAQMYIPPKSMIYKLPPAKDIFYYADKIRSRIILNLERSGFGKQELPVIAALILGQQQDIAPQIVRDYQYAGAVHILSVSGLHVGLLLVFLNLILKYLPRNKRGNAIRLAVILIVLWGFAVLAGLSPSVIRSVTMFSFVAIGMHLRRQTNIFHTLVVSMLLILLVSPGFIFDVGFQLSYSALFFILWLQPLFSRIWQPENRIVKYFWDIMTVSFAAQIGTIPLSLYYFHQFPGLFFLTNLVILPCLGLIMGLGLIVMITALFGSVTAWLIIPLESGIKTMNYLVRRIASFDSFVMRDIPMTFVMMLGFYLMIFCIISYFKKPNIASAYIVLISIIVIQFIYFKSGLNNENGHELIVYSRKKASLISERRGKDISIWVDVPLQKNPVNAYAIAHSAEVRKVKNIPNVIFFNGKKILIIDKKAVYPGTAKPNIILLRSSPKFNLERYLQNHRPEVIIADASNYKSYVSLWERTCRKAKIPFHAVGEKGFFRLSE